jgi:hypothetical protein
MVIKLILYRILTLLDAVLIVSGWLRVGEQTMGLVDGAACFRKVESGRRGKSDDPTLSVLHNNRSTSATPLNSYKVSSQDVYE